MEPREMSESMQEFEKDVTLNSESAVNAEETDVKNEVTPEVESVQEEEKTLVEEAPIEPVAEVAATDEVAAEDEPLAANYAEMGKEQLVEALEQIAQKPIETVKGEVAAIKAAFFAIRKNELAEEKAAFLEKGNEEAAFAPRDDEAENRVKELFAQLKEKRAEYNAAQEAAKAENLEKKRNIISQIEEITSDPDNINRQYSKVQQLQQDFKAVGAVPAPNETEVWKSYQAAMEKFYDLLKINKELRDYDFKKNLELKQQLCADAETLDEETDIVAAFKKLQELHATWREVGPVAKELREDLWARFKNASSAINKKYQAFFEERKAHEQENADAKMALCEKIEAINIDDLKSFAAWDNATKAIKDLQEEWRKLGFASRKVNAQLFARFRQACDAFFAKKAEYYKQYKEMMAANLAKKNDLCERAEALKDSTEWRKATDAFVALQKEWKTVGPVAKKHSDAVWKRFIAACDYFFEQKKKQFTDVHAVEHENLKAKRAVIADLRAALENEDTAAAAQSVRDLMGRWGEIGHVPFKEKDKIYAEYRAAVDEAYEKLDMKGTRANMANFENAISQMSGTNKVYHERERLVRAFEQKCNELKTFENNMGFFNAQSKSGNSLVKEMERRILKIKEEIALLEQKIKLIDEKETQG